MAIGPTTMGRFSGVLPQRFWAAATSPASAFRAESEPAKSMVALLNAVTPSPDPVGL